MAPRPALDRLRHRPHPDDWSDDELLSLSEAAALFFPKGPLTVASLRVAKQRSELACVDVCGRTFTTPRAIRTMKAPRLSGDVVEPAAEGQAVWGPPITAPAVQGDQPRPRPRRRGAG